MDDKHALTDLAEHCAHLQAEWSRKFNLWLVEARTPDGVQTIKQGKTLEEAVAATRAALEAEYRRRFGCGLNAESRSN